jgi:protein-tyrosine-phosphatase
LLRQAIQAKTFLRDKAVSRSGPGPTTAYLFEQGNVEVMGKSIQHKQNTMLRRQFVMVSLFLTITLVAGCAAQPVPKGPKILFVCQYGTAKSAIAREVFRQRAKQRGISADVFSRGITLEDHMSAALRENLHADAINTEAIPAQTLARKDWLAADILIKFNPLPPSVDHSDVRDWTDVPSVNDDYANARKVLNARIDALLDEIAGN